MWLPRTRRHDFGVDAPLVLDIGEFHKDDVGLFRQLLKPRQDIRQQARTRQKFQRLCVGRGKKRREMEIIRLGHTAPEGTDRIIELEIGSAKAEIGEKADRPLACADHAITRALLMLETYERRTAKQRLVPLAQKADRA